MIVFVSICMGLSLALNNLHAVRAFDLNERTEEEIIEDELSVAIISGEGTPDNPYVVDYSLAPTFSQYMNEVNETVMGSLSTTSNNGVGTYGIYDGILQGDYRYNQNYGGYWVYDPNDNTSPPSVNWNGNVWMKKVVYVPIDATAAISTQYTSSIRLVIQQKGADFFAQPLSDIKDELIDAGFTAFGAASFAKAMGKVNSIFSVAETMAFVIDLFNAHKYQTAKNNGYGMINATYQTSYNGSWYLNYGEDTWTTANTVILPATSYGRGDYTSYSGY